MRYDDAFGAAEIPHAFRFTTRATDGGLDLDLVAHRAALTVDEHREPGEEQGEAAGEAHGCRTVYPTPRTVSM